MNRQQSILISSVLITGLVAFGLGYSFASSAPGTAPFKNAEFSENDTDGTPVPGLEEVWAALQKSYYDGSKLTLKKLEYGAVRGFVSAIDDPYTVFMDPEESKEFGDDLSGTLEGIGAELDVKEGRLTVVTPLKNSPAQAAGIKSGDFIYKIDNDFTEDMTLYEAIHRIRGPKGTVVTLTLIREGNFKPFEAKITRDEIALESVTVEKLDGDIFHVSISQFSDRTKAEFNPIIERLLLEKADGIVLDLRGNGGGFLDVSIDIVSEFLKGEVPAAIIKKRAGEENEIVKTDGSARLADIPLAVLVDGGSASASEIVAGAIQDYKRGAVMGEKTFGKGSVQEINELKDGSSLRLTIAKWFTPLDRSIDGVGITPDKEVKFTEEDAEKDLDPQLAEAVKWLKK